MIAKLRLGAAVVGAVLVLLGMRSAIVNAMADLPFFETWYRIQAVGRTYKPLDEGVLDAGKRRLEYAIEVNPADGNLRESLALVDYWRSGIPAKALADRVAALDNALLQSVAELSRRPSSAYGYSIYATIKRQRAERDTQMFQALRLALKYGPNEGTVQENVLDAGLRSWNLLSEPDRHLMTDTLSRAMQARPKETVEFLKARKPLLPGCSNLGLRVKEVCG